MSGDMIVAACMVAYFAVGLGLVVWFFKEPGDSEMSDADVMLAAILLLAVWPFMFLCYLMHLASGPIARFLRGLSR